MTDDQRCFNVSMAVIIRLDVSNVKHDANDLHFNNMSLCLQNCEYLAENKLTNTNLLFFIIMYTLIHVPNYVYFGVNILLVIICFTQFFIMVYNMCSYCKCQMCQFMRYVLLNVILYVLLSVSIFHNFT